MTHWAVGVTNWLGDPERLRLLGTAVLALAAVAIRAVWRVTRTVVTIAHEGGHATAALVSGRRLAGIRLHSDTSGVTVSAGPPRGAGMVFTLLAGYPAPCLLGLGAAGLVAGGHARLMLWLAIGLLLATLAAVRNPYGVLAVLVAGAAVGVVSWYGSTALQSAFAAALAWFLLLGGVRAAHELPTGARRAWPRDSDADQLGRLTGVAAGAWAALFVLTAAAALGLGGWLMLA